MFSFGEKKAYPMIHIHHIVPVDKPVTTPDAKRVYKQWMVKIGFYPTRTSDDRRELADAVAYLGEVIHERESELKGDYEVAKEDQRYFIDELKAELRYLRKELSTCKDSSKMYEINSDIAECETELAKRTAKVETAYRRYADFKANKRAYLIDYINAEVRSRSPWGG